MGIDDVMSYMRILQSNSETMQPEVISAISQTIEILVYVGKNLNFKKNNDVELRNSFISGLFKISNANINETINYMNALLEDSGVMTYEIRSAIDHSIVVLRYIEENSDLRKYDSVSEIDKFIDGLYKVI